MKMFDRKILLCAGALLFVASCSLFRPKPQYIEEIISEVLILPPDSEWYLGDDIEQWIYRYQQNDTLLYDYRCTFSRPEYRPLIKICGDPWGGKLYTYYAPSSRSGVFGMNIESEYRPGGIQLPDSNALPLYRFQIDTVIRYQYMTYNEQKEDLKNDLYRFSREHYRIPDYERFYKYIWSIEYESVYRYYHYYDEQDSIEHSGKYPYCEEDELLVPISDLSMCYFPMERLKLNYYQHGTLMKRFLGFCVFDDTIEPQYLQEMDTALLALPTKHFIREFLRTERLDCLDGKTFPLPQKQPHAPPETVIP